MQVVVDGLELVASSHSISCTIRNKLEDWSDEVSRNIADVGSIDRSCSLIDRIHHTTVAAGNRRHRT